METIFRFCFWASSASCGSLAIVPSSFMISQITPPSFSPASLVKSIAASVCPARFSTPPSLALRGKICPGRMKSVGLLFSSIKAKIVLALSLAEIPVDTPSPSKSTDTVKAVSFGSVLRETIASKPSSSHLLSGSGVQISPRPWMVIKLIISGVVSSAAERKSPSFSRFSSSTTMMILPFLRSSMASEIVFNVIFFMSILFLQR